MVGDSDLATSVIPTKDYTLSAITVDAAAGILYGLGLMIVLPDSLSASVVGREDHVAELEDLIEKKIEKKVSVEVRHVEEGRHFEDTFVDIEKKINMKITVED